MSPRISTYALTIDTPLFHHSMHIPFRFISAEQLDCMERTSPMSLSEDETGVKLIIFFFYYYDKYATKSPI